MGVQLATGAFSESSSSRRLLSTEAVIRWDR